MMTTRFLKFSNAYKNNNKENIKENYTNLRVRINNIVDYDAFEYKNFKKRAVDCYSTEMRDDLGDTAYGIIIRYTLGKSYNEHRVYFWTKQQRDATLEQLDTEFQLFVPTIQANTVAETIPTGSAIIQDLPTLS